MYREPENGIQPSRWRRKAVNVESGTGGERKAAPHLSSLHRAAYMGVGGVFGGC
jgi:hypothetical protein